MTPTKVFIDLSSELYEDLYSQNLNLSTLLKEDGVETGKEELQLKGEPVSRGIITYALLLYVAEKIIKELLEKFAEKALEEAGKQLLETTIGRILKPVLKWIEGTKKDDEKIVININCLIQKKDENGEEILELQPLSDEIADKVEKFFVELKKEKA